MNSIKSFLNVAGLFVLASQSFSIAHAQNLLINGGFESGAVVSGNTTDIDTWDRAGTQTGYIGDGTYVPREGTRLALFNAGGDSFNGALSQSFTTVPGQNYTVSVDVGIVGATGKSQRLGVIVDGTAPNLVAAVVTVAGPTKWVTQTYSFTADGTSATLLLSDQSSGLTVSQRTSADLVVDKVSVTLDTGGNASPVAVADAYSTNEDTPLVVNAASGLLGNDTDAETNPLTAIKVTDPANGSVTVNANGSFTYTPNSNFAGTDSFTYKANDATSDSNVATVTLTVNAVNDAPVAVADSYVVTLDTPLVTPAPGVLSNDTDVESGSLTAIEVTGPSNGSLTLNTDGSFTYTPTTGYTGADSFTYKANDGTVDSAPVAVSLTVQAPAPIGLLNGSFEDGTPQNVGPLDNWTITGSSGPSGTPPFAPFGYLTSAPFYVPRDGNRLVVFNAGSNTFDGKVTQSFGTVIGETYEVRFSAAIYNASGTTSPTARTQKVRLTVKGNGGATLLTATEDVSGPRNATTWRENILHTFVADSATTEISFDDNVTIAGATTTGATTSDLLLDHVRVTAAGSGNTAPVAVADAYSTAEDTPLTIAVGSGLLVNDTDADTNPLTASKVTDPANGTVTVNSNGSFTYTPNANFNGTDSFTYKANDGLADSNTATVTLTVNAVNDAPVAVADSYNVTQDTPLVTAAPGVLANDIDVENGTLTAIQVTGPTNGSLTLNSNGGFTYTPSTGYTGADSFTYKANDGTLDSAPVTVSLTVQAPAPVGLLNGSFESGTPQNVGPLDNWTITGTAGASGNPPFPPFGFLTSAPFYVPRDGNRLVVFNAASNTFDGKVSQTFGTVIGQTYEVRFSAAIYNASGTTSPTS
ncbi:MAG: Ig-like domain-containing protein, partial [Akkermansiaceae bacterium]|nr:Ig-like domain-containing protein [Akkermansiaceae bacterium]